MNSFDKDKIFLQFSNEKKSDSNINLNEKITKGERYFRQLFKKAFGKETITQKPETLKALERHHGAPDSPLLGIGTSP